MKSAARVLDLHRDLVVFDAVEALQSTQLAASVLELPQSSVSRRYRAFASDLCLGLSPQSRAYSLKSGHGFLRELRDLAQKFRILNLFCRWAAHPALIDWLSPASSALPGRWIPQLSPSDWPTWLEERYVDQVLTCQLLDPSLITPAQLDNRSPFKTDSGQLRQLMLLKPPSSDVAGGVQLGSWAALDGLADRLSALGHKVAPPIPSRGGAAANPGAGQLQLTVLPELSTELERVLPSSVVVALEWCCSNCNGLSEAQRLSKAIQFHQDLLDSLSDPIVWP